MVGIFSAAIFSYVAATIMQFATLSKERALLVSLAWLMLWAAIILHGIILYQSVDVSGGQNLTPQTIFSMITWLIVIFVMSLSMKKKIGYLGMILYPLAVCSLLFLSFGSSTHHIVDTRHNTLELVHILLSIVTFSVLTMAGLQAVLLAYLNYHLRGKPARGVWLRLPPLENMEQFLFQMIGVGFVLLTVLLISSYYFFHPGMWGQFLHKALLGGLAWFTFVLLLIGRCWLGWRGNHAVSYTLIGVSFLLLAYFGTTFIG